MQTQDFPDEPWRGFRDQYDEARITRIGDWVDLPDFTSPDFNWPNLELPVAGTVSWWWLRSPGFSPYGTNAAAVGGEGVLAFSAGVNVPIGGVRPALWVLDTPQADTPAITTPTPVTPEPTPEPETASEVRIDVYYDVWNVWWELGDEEMRQLLGEPIDIATYRQDHGEAYIYTFIFRDGLSVSGFGVHVDYQQAENLQHFHFRGIDGTSTRDDVVALIGQPDFYNAARYVFDLGEWYVLAVDFDHNFRVIEISISSIL